MGTLSELRSPEKNVHLLITTSNLAEIYVYDELKDFYHASLDSILTVDSKSSFKDMLELLNIQPYFSEKWLIVLDYSKLKAQIKVKKGIFDSQTACFLVKVKNYMEFKEFKELYPRLNDLYLSLIRYSEVMYLLKDYDLSQKVKDFVAKSYSKEPEKVFTLKKELDLGYEVKNQKDVTKLCGLSTGSINYFAMSLLKAKPTTEKGKKTVYRNRLKVANDLIEVYGVSTFKNYLTSTIKDFIYIKQLYISGVIYDQIKDLPECFDEKKLSRYSMFLEQLEKEISYSNLMRLYILLKESKTWYSKLDLADFLYKYYG